MRKMPPTVEKLLDLQAKTAEVLRDDNYVQSLDQSQGRYDLIQYDQ